MAIKVNFGGTTIFKPGYSGDPWCDIIWKLLKKERDMTDVQVTAFLHFTDTLIRLDMHQEGLWRGHNVK